MILYNVTVKISLDVHEEWLAWMKNNHIPKVLATGYFTEHKFFKVLFDDDEEGKTYSIQYFCNSMKDLQLYQGKEAPALMAEHAKKYEGKFHAFRTLLEQEETN